MRASHPSARWVTPADGWEVAHRLRADMHLTGCNITGHFIAAGADKALCPVCYPGLVEKGPRTNVKTR